MTDQTENPNTSAQDDIRIVLQETLIEQATTILNFTRTEGFALQVPETDTLILVGRASKISEFLYLAAPTVLTPYASINGESCYRAVEVDAYLAALASQSQAAQPTTTAPLKLYAFTEDGMEIDNAFGHWYKKDDVERLFAAHIAGTSQATKAQAEPTIPAHLSEFVQAVANDFTAYDEGDDEHYCRGCSALIVNEAPGTQHQDDCIVPRAKAALAAPVAKEAPAVPDLTVWYGPMPESNGASNFTATLMRKGASAFDTDSYTFARSEYPDRVRYEADCMRHLIGELAERPDILDYDADKHSGYIEPVASVAKEAQPNDTLMALIDLYSLIAHNRWGVPDESYHFITNAACVIEAELGQAPAPVAKEATRDAETAEKANVLPPFAAPAGQQDADERAFNTLYGAVMNIPCQAIDAWGCIAVNHYKLGHRDARHAAADLIAEFASGFREGRNTKPESTESGSDIATTTSTVSAPNVQDDWLIEFTQLLGDYVAACIARHQPNASPDDASVPRALHQKLWAHVRLAAPSSTEGAQKAPEEVRGQWISVGERLPELHQTVALLDEKRWMNTGSSEHNVNWHGSGYLCEFGSKFWSIFGEMRSQCLDAVTHWMPLPAAPSADQADTGSAA